MSKRKEQDVALACYAMVSGQFASFTNERNRGPNFLWDNFPDMMADHAQANIFLHVVGSSIKEEHSIRQTAEKFGREIATTLLQRMKS